MKKIFSLVLTLCFIIGCTAVPMVASAEDVDLALSSKGATVTTSTGTQSSGPAANAIDDDTSNEWWCWTSAKDAHWIQVDLGKCATVSKIEFYTKNGSSNQSNYTVSYSIDGVNWSDEIQPLKNVSTSYLYLSLSAKLARYVKISMNAGVDKNMRINEIWVYGTYTALPYLSSLTSSAGTFTSAFDMETTDYKVQVDNSDSLPTLSYETYVAGATAEVTQQASAENNYTAIITVTHDGETKNYTVQFVEHNWALAVNGSTVTSGMENMVDGNLSTKFYLKHSITDDFVVTLKDYINISKVRFTSSGAGAHDYYDLWYSVDGNTWTELQRTVNCDASQETISGTKWSNYIPWLPVTAKYLKFETVNTSKQGYNIEEFEIYGTKLTDTYTTNAAVSANKLLGNVAFLNNGAVAEADKYYLMAVYVDDELYQVVTSDKSSVSVNAGGVATTALTSKTLPATGTVTAKLFVWNNSSAIVPVITPIDLK